MKRYSFDDVYNDFFGVETPKEDNKEVIKKDNDSMKDIFDDINTLHITDESKDLLKKIIEYMRKYNEKIEENYITFNISLISNDKEETKKIKDILAKASSLYNYIDKDNMIDISLYKLEKPSDLTDYYLDNGLILLNDLKALYLNDIAYQSKFMHILEENLNSKKITVINGIKDEINRFFEGNNLKEVFTFNIELSCPDVQDVYQSVLARVKLDEGKEVELLDYISETFPKTQDSLTNYQDKLCNYISFNKEIPKLESEKTIDEIFSELNELVGLEDIKKTIHELVDLISLKSKTKDKLSINDVNLHMVFLGNPGTGKTTVARMLAGILYNLKYIRENKLIEVTSKDLVAEYVGQTAPKTNEVINRALGGVLFIDEAYALATGVGDANSYNAEAIATLIAAMENHRDDLVVIFAGYTKEMNAFLDSNSGIVSRIGYTLEFKDYTEDELVKIFEGMTSKAGFYVTPEAIKKLRSIIKEYIGTKNFGNARFIRNVYEKSVIKHASNTKNNKQMKLLKTITDKDITADNLIKQSI